VYTQEQGGRERNISRTAHLKSSLAGSANLGMEANITRRDFLGLRSVGFRIRVARRCRLAQNDDFTGYGGVGDYSTANGNTLDVLEAGHAIRDRAYDPLPKDIIDTGELYDCVVIGGGISGLAAA
jgi:spermidine dehydrogenase